MRMIPVRSSWLSAFILTSCQAPRFPSLAALWPRPYSRLSKQKPRGTSMNTTQFCERREASIGRYDLLGHPFYGAWSAGELSREDLREYARHYYHHVHAFPGYLAEFALRLDEGELRRAVLANMVDEKGTAGKSGKDGVPHAELWLDFAEGMGARR